jgi:hypothetical protein
MKALYEAEGEERIEAMQELINSGMAWRLEGAVGREAMEYINAGLCMLGEQGHKDYWGNYVPSRYELKENTKGTEGYVKLKAKERGEI